MATVGERIKQLRKKHAMSQSELAQLAGVKSNTVSTWERGTRTPDFEVLCKLAGCFGVSLEYIIGDSVNTPNTEISDTAGMSVMADDVYYMVKKYCRLSSKSQKIIGNIVDSIYKMELESRELSGFDPLNIEIGVKKFGD